MIETDVVIIGAGASGLMCALTAGYRDRQVIVLEHTKKVGRKILMSGGGRCNFTNIHNGPHNFLSANPHFAKSALSRYSAHAFIEQVERHGIEFHEKTLGQLFCNESSREILGMLLAECEWAGVDIHTEVNVTTVNRDDNGFTITTNSGHYRCKSLVIATGGLSIPNGGATGFAYDIARQFGLEVTDTRAALVPFTLQPKDLEWTKPLAGVSIPVVETHCNGQTFREALLFTHRGLSGPAILQISSFWAPGDTVEIDLLPEIDVASELKKLRDSRPKLEITTALGEWLTKRLAQTLTEQQGWKGTLAEMGNKQIEAIATQLHRWPFKPSGTEGYRTAEVTLGGINTDGLSSRTLETKTVPGLYFIGECLDVTGHLGGHNFQWAWASGVAAGQAV